MNRRVRNYIKRDIANTVQIHLNQFLKALLFRSNLIPIGTELPYLTINQALTDPAQYFIFRYGARYFIQVFFHAHSHVTQLKKRKKSN